MEAGADDYLVKPFSARELLARAGAHVELARVRRQAAAALRESEERFRNMAEHAPVMIWVTERDGQCSFLNQRWYDFTGLTVDESLGFGWLTAVHPDDRDRTRDLFLAANEERRPLRLEYRLRRADGDYRWAIVTAAPRTSPDGRFLGYIGSVIDITERKQAEEERERLLLREQEARLAAEDANRAKAQFLATMSHELRTPLNAIMGFTDLLEAEVSGPLNSMQQRQLSRIDGAARHLLQIIEEILSFSRVEAGREELHLERVDLTAVARETAHFVEPLAENRRLDFRVDLPDAPMFVTTDPGKVRQILLNLLSNAIKFTERGTVELVFEAGETELAFRVRDTGPGIAGEDLDRIFEPFRQIDRSRTTSRGGTGLGLSVSRQLAHLMGGDLTAESRPGEGSTFTLTVPRETRPGEAPPAEPTS
jgi:PAS domain S-box-containing protein